MQGNRKTGSVCIELNGNEHSQKKSLFSGYVYTSRIQRKNKEKEQIEKWRGERVEKRWRPGMLAFDNNTNTDTHTHTHTHTE